MRFDFEQIELQAKLLNYFLGSNKSNINQSITIFLASNPLHRIEFGPPKFFSKTCTFSIIFYSTLQFSGGGHFQKACRSESRKNESKQSEITCKQSEPARSISKIQKKRKFVRVLYYEQCPKNSFKRLYIVEGLLVLVEKASFSKEFR